VALVLDIVLHVARVSYGQLSLPAIVRTPKPSLYKTRINQLMMLRSALSQFQGEVPWRAAECATPCIRKAVVEPHL
jgi:hypothetical protein